MRECIKCGGSALRDYAWGCEHDFGEAPEPSFVGFFTRERERVYFCRGESQDGAWFEAEHPTREGAIALWQERWRWGPVVAALFGWLCERPKRDRIHVINTLDHAFPDGAMSRRAYQPHFREIRIEWSEADEEAVRWRYNEDMRVNRAREIVYAVEQRLREHPSFAMMISGHGLEFACARDGMTSIVVRRRPGNDADAPLAVYGGLHELVGDVYALLGGKGPLAEAGQ